MHKGSLQNSDIYFLVEYEERRGLFDDFVHLSQFLEDLFKKRIDIEEHMIREEQKPYILNGEKVEARI